MAKYSKIEKWDHTHYVIMFNPSESEKEGEKVIEYADQIIVAAPEKGFIVEALARREYSVSDELAILRQRSTKKAEFTAYNDKMEAFKAEADKIIAGLNE